MADQDLAITGKDVVVELLFGGVPQGAAGRVVRFSPRAELERVVTQHIGTTKRDIDVIPTGWSVDLELSAKDSRMDVLLNSYILAKEQRSPVSLIMTVISNYRDGTNSRQKYRDLQITSFSADEARGQAITHRLTFETGEPLRL